MEGGQRAAGSRSARGPGEDSVDTGPDDVVERIRIKAGAADERSINVCLGHELCDVRGRYAAAVEDAGLVGDAPGQFMDLRSDEENCFFGLVRVRGNSSSNRPNRLIGDDD